MKSHFDAERGGMSEGMPILIFFRAEGFYPVEALPDRDLKTQAADHAELNPGTLRVEDIEGNVLWQMQ
jgi:hypothetical protein